MKARPPAPDHARERVVPAWSPILPGHRPPANPNVGRSDDCTQCRCRAQAHADEGRLANGKTDVEHAAQTDTFNLVDGTSTNIGSIHDQSFGQGVVIHDVGILRFIADGSLAFEAGQHQGFDGDPAAIASLCDSLS